MKPKFKNGDRVFIKPGSIQYGRRRYMYGEWNKEEIEVIIETVQQYKEEEIGYSTFGDDLIYFGHWFESCLVLVDTQREQLLELEKEL